MSSSVTMKSYIQASHVGIPSHTQQRNSCCHMASSTPQAQYYIPQRRTTSHHQNHQPSQGLRCGQTPFQPSQMQMPQVLQNPTAFTNSPTLANGQFVQGTPSYTHQSQDWNRNAAPQQNHNIPQSTGNSFASYLPPAYINEDNNLLPHQAGPPQTFTGEHTASQMLQDISRGEMGARNGAFYIFTNNSPAVKQISALPKYTPPTGPTLSSYNARQVQYSSQIQTSPPSYSHFNLGGDNNNNNNNNNTTYVPQHSVIHAQTNQTKALSLHQDCVQPQQSNTTAVSGRQSKHVVAPAIQGNTQPQGLQLNKENTELPKSSQVPVSSSAPTSMSYSDLTFRRLLTTKNMHHDPGSIKPRCETQGQTPGHISNKATSTKTPLSGLYSVVNAKSREARSSKKAGAQSLKGLRKDSQSGAAPRRNHRHKIGGRVGEAQHSGSVDKPKDFMPLEKGVLQCHKAVAVVPPISQQVPNPDQHIESLPFKTHQVWGSKDVELNASSDEIQVDNEPSHESTLDTNLRSQGLIGSTASTSQSPEVPGQSGGDALHSSGVRVGTFTLYTVRCILSYIESTQGSLKDPVAYPDKCVLDHYWGGSKQKILEATYPFFADYINLISTVSKEEMETTVFKHLPHRDLMRLPHGYDVLKDKTVRPTDEFRSSWLNIDGKPADIENVLAEPVKDFNEGLPAYESFNKREVHSGPEASKERVPASTDIQKDVPEDDVIVCESKVTDNVSDTLEQSESESNESAAIEIGSEAECEQVETDANEENAGVAVDLNCSNHSQILTKLLLSSDADDTGFNSRQVKPSPSHVGGDEIPEVSSTPDDRAPGAPDASCTSSNQIKFTCPHVAENDLDDEPFCSLCWEETPLLNLDLEDAVSSPDPIIIQVASFEGLVLGLDDSKETCISFDDESVVNLPFVPPESVDLTMQSEESSQTVAPEEPETSTDDVSPREEDALFLSDVVAFKTSSPKARPNSQSSNDEPTGELRKVENQTSDKRHPNTGNSSDSSSPPSCGANTKKPTRSLDASVETPSSAFGKSPDKQALGHESPKSVRSPSQANTTKSPNENVSKPRYPRKVKKMTKVASDPPKDDLFFPDIVVKKRTSPKSPANDLRSPSSNGKRVERGEEKSPITLKRQRSGQTEMDTPPKRVHSKSKVPSGTPHKNAGVIQDKSGPDKATKKLALYGLNTSNTSNQSRTFQHQCANKEKSSTAPAILSLSNSPQRSSSHTDTPSAKQKVYKDWSSTFFPGTKQKQKRRKKSETAELKSRIQTLKSNLAENASHGGYARGL